MLHKKFTVKEEQALGKSISKKLKDDVMSTVSAEFRSIYDSIWEKKASVSKRRWQFGSDASAIIYFLDEVPFFIQLSGFPEDAEPLLGDKVRRRVLIPTLFFILKVWMHLQSTPEKFSAFMSDIALPIVCRGPTSRFLTSGAHLMMPGIVSVQSDVTKMECCSKAAIFSVGTDVPYALGVTTNNLCAKAESGVGVFIIHCYCDNLWTQYKDIFLASCGPLVKEAICIPLEFGVGEVEEHLSPLQQQQEDQQHSNSTEEGRRETIVENAPGAEADVTKVVDDGTEPAAHLDSPVAEASVPLPECNFGDEENLLCFCLCETVRAITPSMLPIPLTQFTSAVLRAYPRGSPETYSQCIDFKNTSYKKALPFFFKHQDVIEILEPSKGVHVITKVFKNSPFVRKHISTYKRFIEEVQKPLLEEEAREAERKLLQDTKIVFEQKIISAATCYKPRKHLSEELARVLLLGSTTAGIKVPSYPTLGEMEAGNVSKQSAVGEEEESINDAIFYELYDRKTITDNTRAYIKANDLMIVDPSAPRGLLPNVKMNGVLSELVGGNSSAQVPLHDVEELCLKGFALMHEIVIQTSVLGSALTSSTIPPKQVLKAGALPRVTMWSEKRSGNKDVTIIKNLEAFGLDGNLLCRSWKHRFSTSCSVYDPAQEMTRLKSGTKIPLEIHLQGNMVTRMESVLKDIGIPAYLISKGKG